MNKKGQALVEFVIILPIFIFMLLAIIDIGKIIYLQNNLESQLSRVVELYKNGQTYDEIAKELSLNDEEIALDKISHKGYTTKGKGHGYGLSLVEQLVKSDSNLINEKEISKDIFTQRLKIKM